MTNDDKIDLILEDLESWIDSNHDRSDDSMVYAFDNGYMLHAASLWLGTGAANGEMLNRVKGVKIDHKKEMIEINQLCSSADIFICQDCNHHGFYTKGELFDLPVCHSCNGSRMKLDETNERDVK